MLISAALINYHLHELFWTIKLGQNRGLSPRRGTIMFGSKVISIHWE